VRAPKVCLRDSGLLHSLLNMVDMHSIEKKISVLSLQEIPELFQHFSLALRE
jgi:hypothetical protein